jgi:hypothetical protein
LRANSLQSFARAADAAGWRAAGVAAALPAPLPLPASGTAFAPPLHCAVLRATTHGALLALVDGDSLRLLRWWSPQCRRFRRRRKTGRRVPPRASAATSCAGSIA